MAAPTHCFVCSSLLPSSTRESYVRCPGCGHRHATGSDLCGVVVNEHLDKARATRLDGLTRSQVELAARIAPSRGSLLDVGCGTGKFLHHVRSHFDRVVGVEVSEESVQFAREELGLDVRSDVAATEGPFDLITTWHALEHIPAEVLPGILSALRERCLPAAKLMVCVPNPDSWPARHLEARWAFRDVGSHLHEFSRTSLDHLLQAAGFQAERSERILAYTVFAWIQTLANLAPLPHNYLYYRLKRGQDFGRSRWSLLVGDFLGLLSLIFAFPLGAALAFAEHWWATNRAVHAVVYRPIESTAA